jgi:hypothetical protein
MVAFGELLSIILDVRQPMQPELRRYLARRAAESDGVHRDGCLYCRGPHLTPECPDEFAVGLFWGYCTGPATRAPAVVLAPAVRRVESAERRDRLYRDACYASCMGWHCQAARLALQARTAHPLDAEQLARVEKIERRVERYFPGFEASRPAEPFTEF